VRSDEELLEAWRAQDAQAGNELFNRHFDAVCRFFASKLGHEVDDLIQRTFLACVESRERAASTSTFRAYLFGIARNVLRRHFRDKHHERARFDPLEESASDLAPQAHSLIAGREEEVLLLTGLRSLALDHQIILELYYWENLSGPELAQALEIPEGTVRGRIRRAKELLEAALVKLAATPVLLESTLANLEGWARALRDRPRKGAKG
jgi:RNA polymerase sigma-70 factor (ECF subfamily)